MPPEDQELSRIFGEHLAELRSRCDLSQEELGFRAGLHRTEIGMVERGARLPKLGTLLKLAGSLEVSMDELTAGMVWRPGRFQPGEFALREFDLRTPQ
jgi:transcriptional regulator with XRE-family HTH domain